MSVFAGPVLSANDPRHGYENGTEIQVPMEFWKVVVCVSQAGGPPSRSPTGSSSTRPNRCSDWATSG